MNWVDGVGYAASTLIALSLTMSSLVKLRWISLLGALLMACYGGLIGSRPVIALNIFNCGINLFHLIRLSRKRDQFTLLEVTAENSAFLPKFLEFHRADIERYFPGFDAAALGELRVFFILRNLVSVGLVAYEQLSPTAVQIKLDYVIPDYRDLKNAHFVYSQAEFLRRQGVARCHAVSDEPAHQRYLRRMGFAAQEGEPTRFVKALA